MTLYVNKDKLPACTIPGLILIMCFFCSSSVLADSFQGQVNRAFFTTKLKKNEPVNEVLILENTIQDLYFFSDVKNMQGKTLLHVWEYQGKRILSKKFKITKNRQRLISKIKLQSAKTGEWMVIIEDEQGLPVKAVVFKYVKKGSFAGKGIIPVKR